MKNNLKNKLILILRAVILILITIGLAACNSFNGCSCNPSPVYKFAYEISKRDPNSFVKETGNGEAVYHDKSITTERGILGIWPTKGKGINIRTNTDGQLSVEEWDSDIIDKLDSEKIKFFDMKSKRFIYSKGKYTGEIIALANYKSWIHYNHSDGQWEKICYDVSKLEEGTEIESLPIIYKKKVSEKEIRPYLSLVKYFKEKYPPE